MLNPARKFMPAVSGYRRRHQTISWNNTILFRNFAALEKVCLSVYILYYSIPLLFVSLTPPLYLSEAGSQGEGFSTVHCEAVNFHCSERGRERERGDPLSHSRRQKKTAVSAEGGGGCGCARADSKRYTRECRYPLNYKKIVKIMMTENVGTNKAEVKMNICESECKASL